MASLYPALVTSGQSSGPMSSWSSGLTSMAKVRQNRPMSVKQLKEISNMLEASIQAGDTEKAKHFAEELAKEKIKISLDVDPQVYESRLREQSFCLKVILEDRVSTGTCVYLTVKPSDTILDLKRRMMLNYDLPIEVQKWIISLRVCEDKRTLQHYQIKGQGCTAYLYLISAKSAYLDRETYDVNKENALKGIPYPSEMQSGDYATLNTSTMPTLSHETSNSPSVAGGGGEGHSTQNSHPLANRNSGHLSVGAGEARVEPTVEGAGIGETTEGSLMPAPQASQQQVGWQCLVCTLVNKPTRPGCEMCGAERPADYEVPDGYVLSDEELRWIAQTQETERLVQEAERERQQRQVVLSRQNFNVMLELDELDLVPNINQFECPICMEIIAPGNGIVLRECLHMFCKDCLMNAVQYSEEAGLKCPYQDDEYSCDAMLQDREIRALVPDEVYARYLQRSLDLAESQEENSYHCKTADCTGWCIYEDDVNFFRCPICAKENCLTCKAIHQGLNCQQYQEELKIRAQNDDAAKQTQDMLERLVNEGNAMHCPKCRIIVQKKEGCDWIKCSICKTELCWVTKGPRWGPNGPGDTSGGCMCLVNGERCHPNCNNCH